MTLEVTVENKGTTPIYQLRGITKSDNAYLSDKELVFGRIDPGKKRVAKAPLGWCTVDGRKGGTIKPLPAQAKRTCQIPKDAATREDVVMVKFEAATGEVPGDVEIRPTVHSLPKPLFAYAYQVLDNRPGNGDGQLERGEGATIYLRVKNIGKGTSFETQANLRNLTGDGLLLHAGRFDISNMKPGDERQVALTFDVLKNLDEDSAKVELSVVDRDLRVISSEKVTLPIVQEGLAQKPAPGRVQTNANARVLAQPLVQGGMVGEFPKGSVVERISTIGEFTKVRIEGDRFGFIATSSLSDAASRPTTGTFLPSLRRSPPVIELEPVALSTRETHVPITGFVTDSDRVSDVFVFVGNRKTYYRAAPKQTDTQRLPFETRIDLNPGVNVVTVVARENADTVSRVNLIIRRDAPSGAYLPTPKSELFGEDWEFEGE
ncbi:MAG: hypothetical protein QM784_06055 [Polyangiaceae bacterium]